MICQRVRRCCDTSVFESHLANRFFSAGAFYMVGDVESARAKGEKILADLEKS